MKNSSTSPEIEQAEDLGRAASEGASGLAPRMPAESERRHPVDLVWATLHLECPVDDALDEIRGPRPSTIADLMVPSLTSDQALKIARRDAERVYRDLSPYRASVSLEQDGWHVDYELKDPHVQGGGPHYVIDPEDGAILAKQYEQ